MSNTLRKSTATLTVLVLSVAVAIVAAMTVGLGTITNKASALDNFGDGTDLNAQECGSTGAPNCVAAKLSLVSLNSQTGVSNKNTSDTGVKLGYGSGTSDVVTYNEAGSVYATFQKTNNGNRIVKDADLLAIVVEDIDVLTTETVTVTVTSYVSGGAAGNGSGTVGTSGTPSEDLQQTNVTVQGNSAKALTLVSGQLQIRGSGNIPRDVNGNGLDIGDFTLSFDDTTGSRTATLIITGFIDFRIQTKDPVVWVNYACDGCSSTLRPVIQWKRSTPGSTIDVQVSGQNTNGAYQLTLYEASEDSRSGVFTGLIRLVDKDDTSAFEAVTSGLLKVTATSSIRTKDGAYAIPVESGEGLNVLYRDKTDANAAGTSSTTNDIAVFAIVDAEAPKIEVTEPTNNTGTRNRNLTFAGTAVDAGGSGLDVSTLNLWIHNTSSTTDVYAALKAANPATTAVSPYSKDSLNQAGQITDGSVYSGRGLASTGTATTSYTSFLNASGAGSGANSIYSATPSDGAQNVNWSWAAPSGTGLLEGSVSSTDAAGNEYNVDYALYVADLAGNIGLSDADTDSGSAYDSYIVKLDYKQPVLQTNNWGATIDVGTDVKLGGVARTGVAWNSSDRKFEVARNTIVLFFDDQLSNVDASDFKVDFDGNGSADATVTRVYQDTTVKADDFASFTFTTPSTDVVVERVKRAVFLELGSNVPADAQPVVTITGNVTDVAGNSLDTSTDASNKVTAQDGLGPAVTVKIVDSSGNDVSSSKSDVNVAITTDESSSARVDVYGVDTNQTSGYGVVLQNRNASISGNNQFRYVIKSADSRNGKTCVVVRVTDRSSGGANTTTVGKADCGASSGVISYVFDSVSPNSVSLNGQVADASTTGVLDVSVTDLRPLLRVQFIDDSNVNIVQFDIDGVSRLGDIGVKTGRKDYSILLSTDFTADTDYAIKIKGTDALGNEGAVRTFTLKVGSRSSFKLSINAGWNAVSVPSNPSNGSLSVVFSNSSITKVAAYNAVDFRNPWKQAVRSGSAFSGNLSSVEAGRGYWIFSNDFVSQEIPLEGPASATDSSQQPQPITIRTAPAWNFIGVVDQSRVATTGDSGSDLVSVEDYFTGVNQTRVYGWDGTKFTTRADAYVLKTGEAVWAYILPGSNGIVSDIIP